MTTIAWRDGIMAADTATYIHGGDCRMPGETGKMWRLADGRVMGHAGSRRDAHGLMRWLEDPKGDPPNTGDVAAIVVGRGGGRSMLVFDGSSEREVEAPFYALGSGAQAALGAMYAGASAEDAVRIAMLVDPYTGGDVRVERVE